MTNITNGRHVASQTLPKWRCQQGASVLFKYKGIFLKIRTIKKKMEPIFRWHHYVAFISNWVSIWGVPMAWALFHKESRLTPPTLPPNGQDPEMYMVEQSGCFQDEDTSFHYEDSFPINKMWKNVTEKGISMNHRITFVM